MTRVTASADCKASPEVACNRILSEEGLKVWWIGWVTDVSHDMLWPALNTKMSWRAVGGLFSAQVVEDARPRYVVMEVVTPSANSQIIYSFELLPDGGTHFTKTVEPKVRSAMAQLMLPLIVLMLRLFVKKEVQRATVFADSTV